MKSRLIKLLFPLLTFGLLFLSIKLLVTNSYTKSKILEYLQKEIDSDFPFRVSWELEDINILPPSVKLSNIGVFQKSDEQKIVSIRDLTTEISLWKLFSGKFEIAKALAEGGFIKITSSSKSGKPLDLSNFEDDWISLLPIQRLAFKDFSFDYKVLDSPEKQSLNLSGIHANFKKNKDHLMAELVSNFIKYSGSEIKSPKGLKLNLATKIYNSKAEITRLNLKNSQMSFKGKSLITFIEGRALNKKGISVTSSLKTEGDLSFFADLFKLKETKGDVQGTFDLQYDYYFNSSIENSFDLAGQVTSKGARLYNYKLLDSKISLFYGENAVEFTEIDIIDKGRRLGKANGTIRFDKSIDYDFDISMESLSFVKLLEIIGVPQFGLDFDIYSEKVNIKGGSSKKEILIRSDDAYFLDIKSLNLEKRRGVKSTPIGCVMNVDLSIGNNKLLFNNSYANCTVSHLESLKTKKNRINLPIESQDDFSLLDIDGEVDFSRGTKLFLKSKSLDYSLFNTLKIFDLGGKGNVLAKIMVPKNGEAKTEVSFSGEQINLFNIIFKSGRGQLSFTSDLLQWKEVVLFGDEEETLRSPVGKLLFKNNEIDVLLTASQLREEKIDRFLSLFGGQDRPSFFLKSLESHIKGDLFNLMASEGFHKASVRNILYNNKSVADHLDLEITRNGKEIKFEKCKLLHKGFILNCSGSILRGEKTKVFSKRFDLLDSDKINIKAVIENGGASLSSIPYIHGLFKDNDIEGKVKLNLSIKGGFHDISGVVNVDTSDLKYNHCGLPALSIKGIIDHGKSDFILSQRGGALHGRFKVDLMEENLPFESILNFNQFDLRSFIPGGFCENHANYSFFTASSELRGDFSNIENLKGRVVVKDIQMSYNQDQTKLAEPLYIANKEERTIVVKGNKWFFENSLPMGFLGSIADFNIQIKDNNSLNNMAIKVEGSSKANVIKTFISEVQEATGSISLLLEIAGSHKDPKLKVVIKNQPADPINILIPSMPPSFRDIKFNVTYMDKKLLIRKFTALKGAGRIIARGLIDARSKEKSLVNINLDKVDIKYPLPVVSNVDVRLSGDLNIVGNKPPYLITGEVDVLKALSLGRSSKSLEDSFSGNKGRMVTPTVKEKDELFNFNIIVKADDTIKVNSNIFKVWGGANLVLKGTDLKPTLTGVANVNKGSIYYKRNFTINKLNVSFDNETSIDPLIDFEAFTDVSSYRVTVVFNGRVSDNKWDLRIDPALREDGTIIETEEIILLLERGFLETQDRRSNETTSVLINRLMTENIEPLKYLAFAFIGGRVNVEAYPETAINSDGEIIPQGVVRARVLEKIQLMMKTNSSERGRIAAEALVNENITISGEYIDNEDSKQDEQIRENQQSIDLRFKFLFK